MTSQGHTSKWRSGLNPGNKAPEAILLTTHYVTSQNREPQLIVCKLRVNGLKTGEQVSFLVFPFRAHFQNARAIWPVGLVKGYLPKQIM